MSQNGRESQRLWGLDTLRFFAALWVVFGHLGYFPLTEGLDPNNHFSRMVRGIYGNFFAAVPAVIVFFVISGFCIHYPYRAAKPFDLLPYLTRRYLRIGIPLAAAVLLARPFEINLSLFHNSILWSLLAELIYYSLYPAIRRLKARFGWNSIIAGAFILAYGGILLHPRALDYSPFGMSLDWLIVLPCWLLGCRLAESNFISTGKEITTASVWRWRLGIWFLSWLCSVLRFHSPIGYPWTLNFFAIAVFFWLRVEIKYFRTHRGFKLWEWAGQWSYSIYLTHFIANAAFNAIPAPNLGLRLNWFLRMFFVLVFAYVFYLVLEKPGHWLARRAGRILSRDKDSDIMPGREKDQPIPTLTPSSEKLGASANIGIKPV